MNDDFLRMQDGGGDGSEIRDLIYSCLADGARKAKQPIDFDQYDVGDWMEDLSSEEMTKMMEEFTGSMAPVFENKGGKKKVPVKY